MPLNAVIPTRSSTNAFTRAWEALCARWGWFTGRVPTGVTPTLPTCRR
jgi:hypothetical protein